MNGYLEEAAAQLRKAAESADRMIHESDQVDARERIALGFAHLAAVESGLIPPRMVGDILAALVRSEGAR